MNYDMELISGFIEETREILDDVEPTLIEMSENEDGSDKVDSETINAVFRLFHSLKSSAAFLGFNSISSLTHEAETILSDVREGKIPFSTDLTGVLCTSTDIIRNMIDKIESSQNDDGFSVEIEENKTELAKFMPGAPANTDAKREPIKKNVSVEALIPTPAPVSSQTKNAEVNFDEVLITEEMSQNFIAEALEQVGAVEDGFLELEKSGFDQSIMDGVYRAMHSFKGNCGFMQLTDMMKIGHQMETVMESMKNRETEVDSVNISFLLKTLDTLRETVIGMREGQDGSVLAAGAYLDLMKDVFPNCLSDEPNIKPSHVAPVKPVITQTASTEPVKKEEVKENVQAKKKKSAIVRQDIRVELDKLDSIINLVGELVIAESMVTRNPAVENVDDENYYRATHQLRRICSELQDSSMALRMIPLTGLFKKMVRVVHDLGRKTDKKIKLEIIGGETEVDKTVIEQISDPLVHIVRNSCDHGLETKEERLLTDKDPVGRVTIEGRHEGGEVWIIVKDDGRGLNREKILSKALENGIIEEDHNLTDAQIWPLIFEPGFSTADKVSDVSGRGVGMDVVKRNVEKLNGRIDIKSEEGKGSSMILRIPLTLAIIDGMLVQVGAAKYMVPTLSITRSLRHDPEKITISPEGNEILRLDDEFIPIIRMGQLFNQEEAITDLKDGVLVVVDDSGSQIALFVDDILGQQQTVIKGLSSYVNSARGTSGCTILGDGSVALILDIRTLVNMAEAQALAVGRE
jgi:two-component system chemotaxis sensor kinase CheA